MSGNIIIVTALASSERPPIAPLQTWMHIFGEIEP
jgi:hypothetical protein